MTRYKFSQDWKHTIRPRTHFAIDTAVLPHIPCPMSTEGSNIRFRWFAPGNTTIRTSALPICIRAVGVFLPAERTAPFLRLSNY